LFLHTFSDCGKFIFHNVVDAVNVFRCGGIFSGHFITNCPQNVRCWWK